MKAPDYVEPIVGWRVWHVVETRGALRLRSPLYRTIWTPRQEIVAACRRGAESPLLPYWPGPGRHSPPHERCRCGIYASHSAAQAAPYVARFFKYRDDVVHRVIGRVSLWGAVIECERGWRASHAYPAQIYVPAPRRRRLALFTGMTRPARAVEEVAFGLADYGVPVEIVACATVRDVAENLDVAGDSPPRGPASASSIR